MEKRKLGTQGLEVPAIGLGCMGMSISYGVCDPEIAIATIHRAIEMDAGFLDTSDAYGRGANEELLARALEGGRRDRVILASKFGNRRQPDGSTIVSGSPKDVADACEASLSG